MYLIVLKVKRLNQIFTPFLTFHPTSTGRKSTNNLSRLVTINVPHFACYPTYAEFSNKNNINLLLYAAYVHWISSNMVKLFVEILTAQLPITIHIVWNGTTFQQLSEMTVTISHQITTFSTVSHIMYLIIISRASSIRLLTSLLSNTFI